MKRKIYAKSSHVIFGVDVYRLTGTSPDLGFDERGDPWQSCAGFATSVDASKEFQVKSYEEKDVKVWRLLSTGFHGHY